MRQTVLNRTPRLRGQQRDLQIDDQLLGRRIVDFEQIGVAEGHPFLPAAAVVVGFVVADLGFAAVDVVAAVAGSAANVVGGYAIAEIGDSYYQELN